MSEVNKTKCPACGLYDIEFICNSCESPISPQRITEQHTKESAIPYKLQKLAIEKDDILIVTPETPFTQSEAKSLIDMLQSSTNIPFYVVCMNENIKIENLNDEKLKSIGLKRITEDKE